MAKEMPKLTEKSRELKSLPAFTNGESKPRGLRLFASKKMENPIILSLKDIAKLQTVKLSEDFECLEGWMVRDVLWEGANVSSVLNNWEEKLGYRAPFFLFGSGDFTCQLSRRKAFRNTTILATKMYGRQLSSAHGGPLRLVFEGHRCYESIKNVDRIVMLKKPARSTAQHIATSRISKKQQVFLKP